MFGYLSPHKPELKLREYEHYKAHYCGVCHALCTRYGWPRSATLTYEAAFLSLCGAVLPQEDSDRDGIGRSRCLINPLVRVNVCRGAAQDYAADANVLLAYCKCEDDWRDEKSVKGKAGQWFLQGAARRAKRRLDAVANEIAAALADLQMLENEQCAELDEPCMAYGRVLQAVFSGIPGAGNHGQTLGWLGFNLGRWAYLMDAFEDAAQDQRKNQYNVLLRCFGNVAGVLANKERVEFNLLHALSEAGRAAELLPEDMKTPILLNIIDLGALNKTRETLKPPLAVERSTEKGPLPTHESI